MEQPTTRSHMPTSAQQKPAPKKGFEINKNCLILGAVLVVLVAIIAFMLIRALQNSPSATYEDSDTKDSASFALDIDLKRNCKDQKDCDPNKPTYDFKLFVFDKQGTQVRVVRSDDKGEFKASLPEGDYTLVTAKTFESIKGLPQETVNLKNGKVLKLKVNYGTELAG